MIRLGHDVLPQKRFVMSCRFTLLPPSVSVAIRRESAQRRRLTKPLSNCQGAQRRQMAFDKVYR